MINFNTPLWQLTVGEFLELQKGIPIKQESVACKQERTFVYGISGLASLLKCSKATAQKVKNSGIIDKATSQFGRKIAIDANLALELIQKQETKTSSSHFRREDSFNRHPLLLDYIIGLLLKCT